jgi:hypothetical protein
MHRSPWRRDGRRRVHHSQCLRHVIGVDHVDAVEPAHLRDHDRPLGVGGQHEDTDAPRQWSIDLLVMEYRLFMVGAGQSSRVTDTAAHGHKCIGQSDRRHRLVRDAQ